MGAAYTIRPRSRPAGFGFDETFLGESLSDDQRSISGVKTFRLAATIAAVPVVICSRKSTLVYGKGPIRTDAVRVSLASRSAFRRPAPFIRLEFFKLLVLVEAGIVIFPPGPAAAPSSMESNSSELLTLTAVPVFFPVAVLRSLPPTLAEDVTLVLDRVWELTVVLVGLLVVERVGDLTVVLAVLLVVVGVAGGGRSSKGGGATPR